MQRPNRRQILKTTGAGAGVALGAGGASAQNAVSTGTDTGTDTAGTTAREPTRVFTATAQEGFIVINGDSPSDGPISFGGEDIPGDVEIEGLVYSDNTWESTRVSFPDLDPSSLLEQFGGGSLPIDPSQIDGDIEVLVDPITGTFDAEQGLMTADLALTIDVDLTALGTVDIQLQVGASALLTTGTSNGDATDQGMEGSTSGLDSKSATVTLVSNEFPLEETGKVIDPPLVDPIDIDEELGLPSPAGRNWLKLTLDLSLQDIDNQTGPTRLTTFSSTKSDGFISFNTTDPEKRQFSFGESVEGDIRIDGTIYSDATWETTNINIPPIDLREDIVEGAKDIVPDWLDWAVDALTYDSEIRVNKDALAGEYKPQQGLVTGDLDLEIDVDASVEVIGFSANLLSVTITPDTANLTTKTSDGAATDQAMEGSAEGLGTATPSIRLVAQEFNVPEISGTGTITDFISNSVLGTPSLAGENWVDLTLDLALDNPAALDGEIIFDPVVESPPRDLNGDEFFEDVQGSGEFVQQDVDALFDNLASDPVQGQSSIFTFAGGLNRNRVAVVDVQALYDAGQESGWTPSAYPKPPDVIVPETDVELSLETAEETVGEGEKVDVDLVVNGATKGVGAFELDVSLDNTDTAEIVDFDHAQGVSADNSEITDNGGAVRLEGAMLGNAYDAADEITLTTLEIKGLDPGATTALNIDIGEFPAGIFGENTAQYEVTQMSGETVSVEFDATVTAENQKSPGGSSITVQQVEPGNYGKYVGVWSMQNGERQDVLGMANMDNMSSLFSIEVPLDTPMSESGTVMVAVHPETSGEADISTVLASEQVEVDVGPPAILANPPKDPDGDGLYEDVRGDGAVDIFDVQALFGNLDNPDVQNNSELFNFQGGNPDKVTIFDVQSLFQRISE